MLLGCIADDFTGASDLANTLARGGMATTQFSGVPTTVARTSCEAGVVALKTRSIPAGDAVRQSLQALAWLQAQGCRQFLFKYCSTFDSTPAGNIGPVAEALLAALKAPMAIVCPAFPQTGRTIFMGHLFVKDRLLSESGMEHHPLNPMTDPDLRRWLARQTHCTVGLVPYSAVSRGAEAIRAAFAAECKAGHPLIVADAIVDSDLLALGEAIATHTLVTGGSGIALGLPENFRRQGLLADTGSDFTPLAGPGVALSGSCSPASNAQVAEHLKTHPGLQVPVAELMEGRFGTDEALAFCHAHLHDHPLVYSTADPASVQASQQRYGRDAVAARVEKFFAKLSMRLPAIGVTRLAVGGGETSGAVVSALGIRALQVGPEIDPGVPALACDHPVPLRLALKSGNFGSTDFYDKALAILGHP